jgi:hypothetical protein
VRRPDWPLLYLAAGVAYIVLGVAFPELLLSWVVGAGFLVAVVWLVPTLVRRGR